MIAIPKWQKFRERWFFLLVAPLAVTIEWAFAVTLDWSTYPRSEWVLLVDLCIFMPTIYYLFFGNTHALKARLIRTAGVAGLGLLAARYIVPEANQFLLADLAMLRNVLLACVIAFEVWVLGKVVSAIYRRQANEQDLEREYAMPAWIARLMLLEARFWKAVWRFLIHK